MTQPHNCFVAAFCGGVRDQPQVDCAPQTSWHNPTMASCPLRAALSMAVFTVSSSVAPHISWHNRTIASWPPSAAAAMPPLTSSAPHSSRQIHTSLRALHLRLLPWPHLRRWRPTSGTCRTIASWPPLAASTMARLIVAPLSRHHRTMPSSCGSGHYRINALTRLPSGVGLVTLMAMIREKITTSAINSQSR